MENKNFIVDPQTPYKSVPPTVEKTEVSSQIYITLISILFSHFLSFLTHPWYLLDSPRISSGQFNIIIKSFYHTLDYEVYEITIFFNKV